MKRNLTKTQDTNIPRAQLEEKITLLKLCCGLNPLKAAEFAQRFKDEEFISLINQMQNELISKGMVKSPTSPSNFFGRYYTMKSGELSIGSLWPEIKTDILRCLGSDQGDRARQVFDYLLSQPKYTADFTVFKARLAKARNALDKLLGYNLIQKQTIQEVTKYSLYAELVPLIHEVLSSEEVSDLPTIRSDAAQQELEEVTKMDELFDKYLAELLEDRLDETIEFGKQLNISFIADYFREMFGPSLYFDSLLAIAQQYGMTDTTVLNPEGGYAMKTGFHLALFGAPGTGKTFAIKDIILGNTNQGVKAHGLPGRNRYTGGMTPAMFIRIGEAYQGKRFNFIITEFNDWFKYKGMVEPLKLALEQGEIRYETKAESVGPYKFSSFFSTNYNTKIEGRFGYKVTISDPNFNAIEDRMLARLHRMTQERYRELARSQKALALGKIKMEYADNIRDHLVLVYAIQTGHELVKDRFKRKGIILREDVFDKLWRARDLIFEEIKGQVPFSARLERRALQLASTFTLPSFFEQSGDHLEITEEALTLALKFFIEEMAIRSKIEIDTRALFEQMGISGVDQVIKRLRRLQKELNKVKDEEKKTEIFDVKVGSQIKFLGEEFRLEPNYPEQEISLEKIFGVGWKKLQPDSRQFLTTAEMLAKELEQKRLSQDYAPAVIGYSKALERELLSRVFEPFRSYITKRKDTRIDYVNNQELDRLLKDDKERVVKAHVSLKGYLGGLTPVTLGNIWHIFQEAGRASAKAVPVLDEFNRFVDKNKFVINSEKLRIFISDYRNRAAHTEVLTRKEFEGAKELLIGKPHGLLLELAS